MARDYSPRERQKKQLERKQGRRASYDRILIVSEGSKTEPNYFREIRADFRLHTANVEVHPSDLGTAPHQVVQYAHDLFVYGDPHKNIQPKAFEKIFAVFDRDSHESYYQALAKADSLNGKLKNDAKQFISFKAIASIPCFELWLLLHFADIQAPLNRGEALQRLRQHLPNYEKGASSTFADTVHNISIATARAEQLAMRFNARTDPEPYTAIVELVQLLLRLRS
ncbi:MAG TPA: RloB family protein [Cellvibrionaceae bacterium]|nr:RloB family protein [Cellvibrionaceae bacterium]